jgi:hypothetical protein
MTPKPPSMTHLPSGKAFIAWMKPIARRNMPPDRMAG